MSSEPLNGISSETLHTSMQSSLETFIQQSLESAGLDLDGQVTLTEIKSSLKLPSIDITLIASCAKSSVTVRITVDNLLPSVNRPDSQLPLFSSSSPRTSPPSRPIGNGKVTLPKPSYGVGTSSHSQDGNAGSTVEEAMRELLEKASPSTPKAALQTS